MRRWAALGLLIAAFAVPLWLAGRSGDPATPAAFVIHAEPRSLPALAFRDGAGREVGIDAFRGRVVLLNVWATWCEPCRREMPALDRLQAAVGGADFEVVALSIDRAGAAPVARFFRQHGIAELGSYIDASGRSQQTLAVFGIPTTLLIDRDGREVARLIGPAEWDAPAMLAFIRDRIAGLPLPVPPADGARRPSASPRSIMTLGVEETTE